MARVEEWVRCRGLDDSLVLHYNLAAKQQTVAMTLPTDAANGRTNNREEKDVGDDGKKYLKGTNYSGGNVPKIQTTSQKTMSALEMILNRTGSITVRLNAFDSDKFSGLLKGSKSKPREIKMRISLEPTAWESNNGTLSLKFR